MYLQAAGQDGEDNGIYCMTYMTSLYFIQIGLTDDGKVSGVLLLHGNLMNNVLTYSDSTARGNFSLCKSCVYTLTVV